MLASRFLGRPDIADVADDLPVHHPELIGLDALAPEITWLSERGVDVRRIRSASDIDRRGDRLVLYVVEPGIDPPSCGEAEDWIREPVRRSELLARAERLIERGAPVAAVPVVVDDDGLLHADGRIEMLSPQEARLMRTLLHAAGQMVSREDLTAAVWPDGPPTDPRALDNRVKALRQRLVGLPIELHTVRGRGLLLDISTVS